MADSGGLYTTGRNLPFTFSHASLVAIGLAGPKTGLPLLTSFHRAVCVSLGTHMLVCRCHCAIPSGTRPLSSSGVASFGAVYMARTTRSDPSGLLLYSSDDGCDGSNLNRSRIARRRFVK